MVIKKAKLHFRRYFITGLLVVIPIWGTYLVLSTLLGVLDGLLGDILKGYSRLYIPGMGILALVILIFVIGLLTANFLGRKMVAAWDRLLARVPLVKNIYSAFKHVVDVVSLQGKENFSRVVLIEFPRKGNYSIAFVTGVTGGEVQKLTPERVINVYVPTTPNPTSGYLILVPESEIVPLSMSVEDG
ncbi:MAG: DUF502 domain-containing protein, partial [Nitrospirae bacterium]|nr:DUF502 domain-containing protein [Nitrospirota bacterium]